MGFFDRLEYKFYLHVLDIRLNVKSLRDVARKIECFNNRNSYINVHV